jgi:hypothetical protein
MQRKETGLSGNQSTSSRGQRARKGWQASDKFEKQRKDNGSALEMSQMGTSSHGAQRKASKTYIKQSGQSDKISKSRKTEPGQLGVTSIKGERSSDSLHYQTRTQHNAGHPSHKKMKYNYFIDIDNPQELEEGAAVRFKDYKHDFINMTERHFVNT